MNGKIEEVEQKYQDTISEFEKSLPKDKIEEITGIKAGTKEHTAQQELIREVQETNSTERILRVTNLYETFSYVSLMIVFIIKIFGSTFDIKYHFPDAEKILGTGIVVFLGVLMAVVIVAVVHLSADAIVNNKWKKLPKIINVTLFLGFGAMGFYMDSRAVENYNKKVMELKKGKDLNNSNSVTSIAVDTVRGQKSRIEREIQNSSKMLENLNAQLLEIQNQKIKINEEISRYKDVKSKTSSKKNIARINSNIYTSRKQLKELDRDTEKINAQIAELKMEIEKKNGEILNLTQDETATISKLDTKLEMEREERVFYAWAFIIFFEVTSFLGIVAKFQKNRNLNQAITKEKLDELNAITDIGGVLTTHIDYLKMQQLQQLNQQLGIGRKSINGIGAMGNIQLMQQSNTVKDVIDTVVVATEEINKIGSYTIKKHLEYLEKKNEQT